MVRSIDFDSIECLSSLAKGERTFKCAPGSYSLQDQKLRFKSNLAAAIRPALANLEALTA